MVLNNMELVLASRIKKLSLRTWILGAFLFLLPVQLWAYNTFKFPDSFLWVDDFILLSICSVALIICIKHHSSLLPALKPLAWALLSVGLVGVVSGLINGNSWLVTGSGVFHYVKSFLLIPAVACFGLKERELRSLYQVLQWVAVILCFFALAQEAVFLLGYKVNYLTVPFFGERFGLMRTPSLMGHPNTFGLYACLFFVLDVSIYRKVRWQAVLFAAGVFLSLSRMAWTAFGVAMIFLAIRRLAVKHLLIIFAVTLFIFGFGGKYFYERTIKEFKHEYRGFVLETSFHVWRDHPLMGVGPGMYGQGITLVAGSPVYEAYGFKGSFIKNFQRIGTLDLFWAQSMAELGLLGTGAFVVLLFVLFRTACVGARAEDIGEFHRGLLNGLAAVPFMIAAYCFGNGLNVTSLLLTYAVFLGGALGAREAVKGR